MGIDRRQFIKGSALAVAAAGTGSVVVGYELVCRRRRREDGTFEVIPMPERLPTVIEGKVEGEKLVITAYDVLRKQVAGRYEFGA